jgi:large subunit ribosomal protein L25
MIRDIEVQSHTDIYLNVNLFEVSLKEEIKASVDFKIINDESLQLSKLRVSQYIKSLNVTGLPNDIPDYIEIDASNFKNGDNILLKDITLPDGIATDADPESLLISVSSFKAVPAQEDTETPDEEQAE